MRGGIVKKNTVGIFVVLAQALAVISDHNDQRSVIPTLFFQVREKVAESRIGVGNLSVVEAIFVNGGVRRRRFVGIVRIIKMCPYEVRAIRMLVEPGFRVLLDLQSAALEPSPSRLRCRVLGKVVVELEAATEPWRQTFTIQNHGADKCRGVITACRQQYR